MTGRQAKASVQRDIAPDISAASKSIESVCPDVKNCFQSRSLVHSAVPENFRIMGCAAPHSSVKADRVSVMTSVERLRGESPAIDWEADGVSRGWKVSDIPLTARCLGVPPVSHLPVGF